MFYPHPCIQYNFPTKFCSLRFPYSKLPVPYDSSEIALYIISHFPLFVFLSHLSGTSKFGTESKPFRLAVSLSHCTTKWRTIILAFREPHRCSYFTAFFMANCKLYLSCFCIKIPLVGKGSLLEIYSCVTTFSIIREHHLCHRH